MNWPDAIKSSTVSFLAMSFLQHVIYKSGEQDNILGMRV